MVICGLIFACFATLVVYCVGLLVLLFCCFVVVNVCYFDLFGLTFVGLLVLCG